MNSRRARGLLARHHVYIRRENIRYIGKESNRLEEVESELEHSLEDVLETYQEPVQTVLDATLEALRTIPAWELAEQAGVSEGHKEREEETVSESRGTNAGGSEQTPRQALRLIS